jgi:uncharacterized protein (TIGR02147 family)
VISTTDSYRSLIKRELEERCARNSSYSLRAFAKHLGLSPSALSEILSGKYGLSDSRARQVATALGLHAEEVEMFRDLVKREYSRSASERSAAEIRLKRQHEQPNYHQLQMDAFKVIADWYHYAILELTYLETFQNDTAWIARSLGINENTVKSAIERLKTLDLLEVKRGRLRAKEDFTASSSGIPSEALRRFHRQILEKAISAIQLQSVQERDLSSCVLAIDEDDIPIAKEAIKKFRRSLSNKLASTKIKTSVYCLSTQFFRISETQRNKKEARK